MGPLCGTGCAISFGVHSVFWRSFDIRPRWKCWAPANPYLNNCFDSAEYVPILFEVPTEQDSKGHKWTMDTGYTEELFYETALSMFTQVERMPGQTEHRPYYLCVK